MAFGEVLGFPTLGEGYDALQNAGGYRCLALEESSVVENTNHVVVGNTARSCIFGVDLHMRFSFQRFKKLHFRMLRVDASAVVVLNEREGVLVSKLVLRIGLAA